ncbi:hypothetical protein DPEC_G00358540 [Dallia pectoralis]|uniref:Uncharacterized protein n=1 Tax=Dallia pectoralis TaxID=75939 RepID=A0ACC2F086_DALPE|nr:hypothetical protein DPEC_G00358540 [Dallia pectoralis]
MKTQDGNQRPDWAELENSDRDRSGGAGSASGTIERRGNSVSARPTNQTGRAGPTSLSRFIERCSEARSSSVKQRPQQVHTVAFC